MAAGEGGRLAIRFGGPDVKGDLDEEIGFHLKMTEQELIVAGWTPDEARREARRRFGHVDGYRRACLDIQRRRRFRVRRQRALMGLGLDLRLAWRGLVQRPGFALSVVLTLGLGIGLTTAVFSLVDGILLRPLPFQEPERLVRLYSANESRGWNRFGVSAQDLVAWREQSGVTSEDGVFENVAMFRSVAANSSAEGRAYRVDILQAWDSFFPLLGVRARVGRLFAPDDDPWEPLVVLSYDFWLRDLGGDESMVGGDLILDGTAYRVIGITEPGFAYPSDRFEVYQLLSRDPAAVGTRGQRYLGAIARLAGSGEADEALATARAAVTAISERLEMEYPDSNQGWRGRVMPMREWLVGSVRETLVLLWVAVGLLLLIACSNVAHLMLMRGLARRRDLATRSALGAGRARLVRELLTESLVLALLGGATGAALAYGAVRWLPKVAADSLPRMAELSVDGGVLAFAFGAAVLTGLLFGAVPAWRFGRMGSRDRAAALQGARGGGGTHSRATATLVVAEIVLACVLLVAAGLVLRSLRGLMAQDLGFQPDGVLAFRVAPAMDFSFMSEPDPEAMRQAWEDQRSRQADLFDQIVDRLESSPLVARAAAINDLPLAGLRWADEAHVEGLDEPEPVYVRVVTPGYFSTLGIPLRAGRDVDDLDRDGVGLINRAAALRFWPGDADGDAIGRTFQLGDEPAPWLDGRVTVRGVVGDVRTDLERPVAPMIYLPLRGAATGFAGTWDMKFVLRGAAGVAATSLVKPARNVVAEAAPGLPIFDIVTLAQRRREGMTDERLVAWLFGVFAASALGLAAVGLYGMMAYAVSLGRHAIGVRLALGAAPVDIINHWLRRGLLLAAAGSSLGLLASLALAPFLRSQLYGVGPRDPWSYGAAIGALFLAALFASLIPARRAARVDPARVLRSE